MIIGEGFLLSILCYDLCGFSFHLDAEFRFKLFLSFVERSYSNSYFNTHILLKIVRLIIMNVRLRMAADSDAN